MTLKELFRISHPDIAWHVFLIMLCVYGGAALVGYLVALHWWIVPALCGMLVTFYAGYHFELGYRIRRFERQAYYPGRAGRVRIG